MKLVASRMPVERIARSPELSVLAVLDAAVSVCEVALFAAHPELACGTLGDTPRASAPRRAYAVIVAARRLALALAIYSEAIDRDERRDRALRQRSLF